MALVKCPECGREISDQAENCIYCGLSLKQETNSLNGTLVVYGYTGTFLVYPKLKIYLDGQHICDVAHKSKSAVIPISKPTDVEIKCGIRSTLVRVQPNQHSEIYTEFVSDNIQADLRCSPISVGGSSPSAGTASAVPNSAEPSQAPQIVIQNKPMKKMWAVLIVALVGIFAFAILSRISNEGQTPNSEEPTFSSSYSCPHCGSTDVWAGQHNDTTGIQNFGCNYCYCTWTDYDNPAGLREINKRDCILK